MHRKLQIDRGSAAAVPDYYYLQYIQIAYNERHVSEKNSFTNLMMPNLLLLVSAWKPHLASAHRLPSVGILYLCFVGITLSSVFPPQLELAA